MRNLEIKNETGRSMIEMLGVLAIIGVLSVGGIAGYSKAMMKYRINKTIEQLSLVSQNVRTFYAVQKNYAGLDDLNAVGKKIIKKAKLVPDEMWGTCKVDGKETECLQNVWGTDFYTYSWNKIYNDESKEQEKDKVFVIGVHNITQEACMELASVDWSAVSSGIKAFYVGQSNSGPIESTAVDGDGEINNIGAIANSNGANVSIPMPLNIAADACGKCTNDCGFYALFE